MEIPSYPDIDSVNFYSQIVNKYEFNNDEESSTFFSYQNNIAKFLSARTIYESLLLIHEMGTGKSGSAIATAHLVRSQNPKFKRIIVLANGRTQLNNFRQEVLLRLPYLYDKYPDTKDRNVILRREGFLFETYRIFSRHIQNKNVDELNRLYNYSIIIMDEIHNITASSGKDEVGLTNVRVYNILYDFVHGLKTRKLLCLTGTPIRDKPYEIAKVLNMVIPEKDKLPIGEEFRNVYLQEMEKIKVLGDTELVLYDFKKDKLKDFQRRIQGYVSYLKKSLPKNIVVSFEMNPNYKESLLDKFKLFVNVMNEPQNTIYLENFIKDIDTTGQQDQEEEGKPSLAYSRSRKTSLFAFPDMNVEYVNYKYEKGTTEIKGKYLKGFGWTKEMRVLFPKDIAIEQKFERIGRYGCIYREIIHSIIYNPSELVYIYSFLKSGTGVYLLASFLTEYFQFEIVRKLSDVKTKATTRRRVLILNHDFMSDGTLRELIDFFNRDENVLGEYIQVVIGTKQTKEGITLKNIRQIHIVQPDWNYADISQAIGRGIRVGSHNALVEKIGQVNVKIFQHCAIPIVEEKAEPQYSIDFEQYRRSEIKDRNIKRIERELLESSWDCFLNKSRNQGLIENSRECEYEKCDINCNGIPSNFQPDFSFDTYNLYYADTERKSIEGVLRQQFTNSNQFKNIPIQTNNPSLLENVIQEMSMNNMEFLNSRQDTTFLRYIDPIYFLVNSSRQHSYYDSYYNQRPIFFRPSSFEIINSNFYDRQFSNIVGNMMTLFYSGQEEIVKTILLQSSLSLQQLLVENIVILNNPNPFYLFILNHYISQGRLSQDYTTSTILPSQIRRFNKNVWQTENIQTIQQTDAEDSNEFIRKFITENPYGFYGIIERSRDKMVFKIRDVRDQELVFGTNKAKIPKGEMCGASFSRKKSGLIEILMRLEWKPKKEVSIEEVRRVSKERVKLLNELKLNVEEMNEIQLYTVYELGGKKIPELCEIAKRRFMELGLIQEKRV